MGQCAAKPQAQDGMHAAAAALAKRKSGGAGGEAGKGDTSHFMKASVYNVQRSITEGLANIYKVKTVLGSGAGGTTWLCQDLATKEVWALKMFKLPLPQYLVQSIMQEIQLQSALGEPHLNIITPQELVLTSHYLGLVMECASGGSMAKYVTHKWRNAKPDQILLMPESEALYFVKQIVDAIIFCHKQGVAHRDIKLDNTLLSADDPPYIKICDFGFAKEASGDCDTVIGTPDYMSPQLTKARSTRTLDKKASGSYDPIKADVWALGVMICVMLLGKFPFEGDTPTNMATGDSDPVLEIYRQQTRRKRWYDHPELTAGVQAMSPELVDLLDHIFEGDEKKRYTMAQVQEHPWTQQTLPAKYQDAYDALQIMQEKQEAMTTASRHNAKERDKAIYNMLTLATSEDFRRQAKAPVTKDYAFRLFSRIKLTTIEPKYMMMDRESLRLLLKADRHDPVMSNPNVVAVVARDQILEEHAIAPFDLKLTSSDASSLSTHPRTSLAGQDGGPSTSQPAGKAAGLKAEGPTQHGKGEGSVHRGKELQGKGEGSVHRGKELQGKGEGSVHKGKELLQKAFSGRRTGSSVPTPPATSESLVAAPKATKPADLQVLISHAVSGSDVNTPAAVASPASPSPVTPQKPPAAGGALSGLFTRVSKNAAAPPPPARPKSTAGGGDISNQTSMCAPSESAAISWEQAVQMVQEGTYKLQRFSESDSLGTQSTHESGTGGLNSMRESMRVSMGPLPQVTEGDGPGTEEEACCAPAQAGNPLEVSAVQVGVVA